MPSLTNLKFNFIKQLVTLKSFLHLHPIQSTCNDLSKNKKHYLNFMYHGENFDVDLDDLDITPEKLEKLLHVYRVRYEKNNPN